MLGCNPSEITNIPTAPLRLVVYSNPSQDKPWLVYVTHTVPILSHEYHSTGVPDASVRIFDGDQLVQELSCDCKKNDSVSTFTGTGDGPLIGHSYEIVVEAPGYQTVRAHYTQPGVVEVESFKVDITSETRFVFSDTNQFFFKNIAVELTFTDPPGKNYYQIMYVGRDHEDPLKSRYFYQGYLTSTLPEYANDGPTAQGQYIDDRNFEGKQVTLKYKSSLNTTILSKDTAAAKFLNIQVRNLSKELYDYQMNVIARGVFNPEGEPYLIESNIENGLGIFAGYGVSGKDATFNPF